MFLLLLSCALRDWVPQGPSLASEEPWLSGAREPVAWTGPAPALPALPFQVFGLRYERDVVVAPAGGPWQMHEYAYALVDGEGIWVAKDSDRSGRQTVSAGLEDLATWLPEVPAPRRVAPVSVVDQSAGERVELAIAYRDLAGRRVELDVAATPSERLEPKRNGSTFEHSQAVAAALLDVPHRQLSGVEASLRYDGVEQELYRVLGLVPVKALLDQTQAGFAIASFRQQPTEDGFRVTRPIPGDAWPTSGVEGWTWDGEEARFARGETRFVYAYDEGGLVSASVWSGEDRLAHVALSGPLPAGRPFSGEVERRFVFYVNDQLQGHGTITARPEEGGLVLAIEPVAPPWLAARPMEARLLPFDGGWQVRVERVPAP